MADNIAISHSPQVNHKYAGSSPNRTQHPDIGDVAARPRASFKPVSGGHRETVQAETWDVQFGNSHGLLDQVNDVVHSHPVDGTVDGEPVKHRHLPGEFHHDSTVLIKD
jgi:hypothetical protein